MIRSLADITTYTLQASDGKVGRCDDVLFNDKDWVVRYLVAKTSGWLTGKRIVISPSLLGTSDWPDKTILLELTKQQIETCPELDATAPISREYEIQYHQYYSLPFYWLGSELWGAHPDPYGVVYPAREQVEDIQPVDEDAEQGNLRSVNEVLKYEVQASDSEVGRVVDFLFDDETFSIRYLVVDTRNWLPGGKVLLSPAWLESVNWVEQKVYTDLESQVIRNCPAYDPAKPISRDYEIMLFDYYARAYYWE